MKFLINIFILLFGLLLSLIGVEVAVRLLALSTPTHEGWDDRPTFYYIPEGAEFMRDRSYPAEKPANTFRIAVVGDSFSFAPYMQFDDTFAKRLERMLNLNITDQKVEVLNYGVPAYSTQHEIALVERAIREQADLVILQVTLNDPELKPYRPTGLAEGAVNRFGQLELKGDIYNYWKTLAFIKSRLYARKTQTEYQEYFFSLFENSKSFSSFNKAVAQIKSLCDAANIKLVAVTFPLFGLPLDADYPFVPLHDKVDQVMASYGISNLDLFSAFKGIPHDRMKVMPLRDFHPNEIAHRIVAERLYLWLEQQNLVPEEAKIRWRNDKRTDIRIPDDLKAAP